MQPDFKPLYDRLVQAEWVDNVTQPDATHVGFKWITSDNPIEHGQFKLALFSKWYRELTRSGPMSQAELEQVVSMGQMVAWQMGWEKPQ